MKRSILRLLELFSFRLFTTSNGEKKSLVGYSPLLFPFTFTFFKYMQINFVLILYVPVNVELKDLKMRMFDGYILNNT